MEELRNKISALLMHTSEDKHLSVCIPLELKENQGLSTLQMLTIVEIWQNPIEGIIMIKLEGVEEEIELDKYEECYEQIYKALSDGI